MYRNTKNRKKIDMFKQYKCIYIARLYAILRAKKYVPSDYNIFTIYEPKNRRIVSQNMQNKVVNHLITKNILSPAILPCLLDVNVASIDHDILKQKKIKLIGIANSINIY